MKLSQRGMTLTELVVVIALIGILAAFAAPSVVEWRELATRREVASDVARLMMQARARAISRNEEVKVAFEIDGSAGNTNNSCQLSSRAKGTAAWTIFETTDLANGIEIRGKVDCTKASGTMEIRFNPDGSAYYGGTNGGSHICVYSGGSVRYSAGVSSTTTGRVVTKRGTP